MQPNDACPPPCGRPPLPSTGHTYADTRDLLIRRGMELLTEQGIAATSIEQVLQPTRSPRGSYHYFAPSTTSPWRSAGCLSPLLLRKLTRYLGCEPAPGAPWRLYVDSACLGMTRFCVPAVAASWATWAREVVQLSPSCAFASSRSCSTGRRCSPSARGRR